MLAKKRTAKEDSIRSRASWKNSLRLFLYHSNSGRTVSIVGILLAWRIFGGGRKWFTDRYHGSDVGRVVVAPTVRHGGRTSSRTVGNAVSD